MSDEKLQKIVYEILTYLAENPKAQDTLEGIVEWWWPERTIKYPTRKVKEALAMLVAVGLVLERRGKDARTYYKVNHRRLGKILLILKQKPGKNGFMLNLDK